MTRDDIRAGLLLSMAEMIRTGTVGFLDMFLWDSGLLADVRAAGLRVQAAPAVFGYDAVAYPRASTQTGSQALDETPRLAAEFAGDELISVSYGLHAPYSCGPELMADVARRSAGNGLGVQIHLSETRQRWRTAWPRTADRRSRWPRISVCWRPAARRARRPPASRATPNCWPPSRASRCRTTRSPTSSSVPGSHRYRLPAGRGRPGARHRLDGVQQLRGPLRGDQDGGAAATRGASRSGAAERRGHPDDGHRGGARALGGGLSGRWPWRGRGPDPGRPGGPTGTPMTNPVAFLSYAARGGDVTDVGQIMDAELLAHRLTISRASSIVTATGSVGVHCWLVVRSPPDADRQAGHCQLLALLQHHLVQIHLHPSTTPHPSCLANHCGAPKGWVHLILG